MFVNHSEVTFKAAFNVEMFNKQLVYTNMLCYLYVNIWNNSGVCHHDDCVFKFLGLRSEAVALYIYKQLNVSR